MQFGELELISPDGCIPHVPDWTGLDWNYANAVACCFRVTSLY
jgi:hypothetical protein